MAQQPIDTLDVRDRRSWRKWLHEHHDSVGEVWLVFHKKHTGVQCLSYDESVEEAVCYGWIDSLMRRLDDDRYARKFTPRRPDSKWSTANRTRYAHLESCGALAEPGLKRPPTARSGDVPKPSVAGVPAYIEDALRSEPRAWETFEQLAPSHRRQFVGWIDSAKRQDTKSRRLSEAIQLLAAGRKLGMK